MFTRFVFANVFPGSMNTWEAGDVISEGWANSLETRIGETGTTSRSSLTFQVNQLMGTTTLLELTSVGRSGNTLTVNGALTVSGTPTFSTLTSCDTIDTNGSGVASCGTDSGAGFSVTDRDWNMAAVNLYIKPTSTIGIIVSASSTFGSNFHVLGLFNASSSAIISGSTTIQNVLNVNGEGATSTFRSGIMATGTAGIETGGGLKIVGGRLQVSSEATSTFNNGLEITGGCFRKAGACLTEISSSLTGILEEVGGVVSTVTIGTGLDYTGTTLSLITPVTAANGGTGQTSYTTGDLLYASSGSALSKLGIGASSTILTVSGGLPVWTAAPAFTKTTIYDILSVGRTGTSTIRGDGASSTISGILNVGGTIGSASSTFNTGIKIQSGCYETATSSCLTNTASFTFRIASSTMSTSSRASQFRVPVDFYITKVSCVTYGASAAIQLDERSAPQTAGTNSLSAALTCTTSGAATNAFAAAATLINQDNFVNLQITDAQPGVARPTMLEVHVFGEKIP